MSPIRPVSKAVLVASIPTNLPRVVQEYALACLWFGNLANATYRPTTEWRSRLRGLVEAEERYAQAGFKPVTIKQVTDWGYQEAPVEEELGKKLKKREKPVLYAKDYLDRMKQEEREEREERKRQRTGW